MNQVKSIKPARLKSSHPTVYENFVDTHIVGLCKMKSQFHLTNLEIEFLFNLIVQFNNIQDTCEIMNISNNSLNSIVNNILVKLEEDYISKACLKLGKYFL